MPGTSANPDASRAAFKRYMISHFGFSPEEAEEALGNVNTPQPVTERMLPAVGSPPLPSFNPASIGGNADGREGLDQVLHPHAMGVVQHTTQAHSPAGCVPQQRDRIAARIKVEIPRHPNESAKDWVHRICEIDEEVQNIERARLPLLAEIVGVRSDQLSSYPLLASRFDEIKRALEIKERHGQAVGESKAAWARHLATIPELHGVEESACHTVIARITRSIVSAVQKSLRVRNAASVGSPHDLVMRVARVSQQNLEEAFSDVEKQPFVDPLLAAAAGTSVACSIAATLLQPPAAPQPTMIVTWSMNCLRLQAGSSCRTRSILLRKRRDKLQNAPPDRGRE